jgi:hypothetical protein
VPEVLLRARDPSGLALAYWLTLARIGHGKGGTTITDEQAAELLNVTPLRIANARNVLIDCDLVHTSMRGRAVLRRAKHDPDSFVTLSYLVVDELWAGSIDAKAARQYARILDARAEPGVGAGCGLTAIELAKGIKGRDGERRGGLGVRPDSIAESDRQLVAAGLLRIETRAGVGKIRVPLHAHPVTRRISATARYALAQRRRSWALPRYPQDRGARCPQAVSPLRTPLPNRDRTPLPNRDQSRPGWSTNPQVGPQIPRRPRTGPINDGELTSSGAVVGAPWDVEGAVWQPQPKRRTSKPSDFADRRQAAAHQV